VHFLDLLMRVIKKLGSQMLHLDFELPYHGGGEQLALRSTPYSAATRWRRRRAKGANIAKKF
jgi:hypothetical protein